MFKDYDKYLSTSLKVYLFVLIIIFILKLVGLDYFGITTDNLTLIKISNFLSKSHLGDIYYFFTIYIEFYFYICLVCKKNKLYLVSFIGASINFIYQIFIPVFNNIGWIYSILCIFIMIIIPMIVLKRITFKRQILFVTLLTLYQFLSLYIRNIGYNTNYNNFLIDSLLNMDQILMMGITYNLMFMKKGDVKKCGETLVVGLSSLKKLNLKNLLKRLQKNWHNFKNLEKVEKLTFIIYFIFSLIWNVLSVVLILFVARLNDTFIECIFILTSFWLSKHTFGKPFHFSSMSKCFIVSNLSYYVLNRLTTPLGISIIVPIMLGVGLSYVTSKLVKKTYKPLYRGMPEELFEETILKVVDKDSTKYKICYDFYIKNKSIISLSIKYNYTEAGIRKIKDRVNEKIKRLN